MLAKGTPKPVLSLFASIITPAGAVLLIQEQRGALLNKMNALASQTLRVLALAYKGQSADAPMSEEGLTFLALAAMSDPSRREAKEAIQAAQRAGIRVVMITGDDDRTAAAVAGEVGLSLLLQIAIVYTPLGNKAFGTVALGLEQWGVLIAGLAVGFIATVAAGKLVTRRFGTL